MSYLIFWYGLIQSAHIVVLIVAGYLYLKTGSVGFPAPGPPAGWSPQVEPFLVGMAVLDLIIASVSLVFVYQYFTAVPKRMLGSVVLTGALVSAILFGLGTFPSGAWGEHPVVYYTMLILFLPVVFLWYRFNFKN
jgi:hypothetical protein